MSYRRPFPGCPAECSCATGDDPRAAILLLIKLVFLGGSVLAMAFGARC